MSGILEDGVQIEQTIRKGLINKIWGRGENKYKCVTLNRYVDDDGNK